MSEVLSKSINQLNSTDIDQMKAVVSGSSQRPNYTNETLQQLHRVMEYYSINESLVASLIDNSDTNVPIISYCLNMIIYIYRLFCQLLIHWQVKME